MDFEPGHGPAEKEEQSQPQTNPKESKRYLSVLSILLAAAPKACVLEAPLKAFPSVMLANNYEKKPLCAQHLQKHDFTVECIPQCHAIN